MPHFPQDSDPDLLTINKSQLIRVATIAAIAGLIVGAVLGAAVIVYVAKQPSAQPVPVSTPSTPSVP